jgi:pilus assembly protein Flp/PilA
MMEYVKHLAKNETGATSIEYGLIAALFGVGVITAAKVPGALTSATFKGVASNMK